MSYSREKFTVRDMKDILRSEDDRFDDYELCFWCSSIWSDLKIELAPRTGKAKRLTPGQIIKTGGGYSFSKDDKQYVFACHLDMQKNTLVDSIDKLVAFVRETKGESDPAEYRKFLLETMLEAQTQRKKKN